MENFRIESIQKALQPSKVEKADRNRAAAASSAASKEFSPLQFSAQGAEVRVALKALQQVPDVRDEKIQRIEEEIRQGKFERLNDLLAEKLIQRIFDGTA